MGIATFVGASPYAGQSLEYDDGHFRLGAGGPFVAPADVQRADAAGTLAWSQAASRDWFYGNIAVFASAPTVASPSAAASPPAAARKSRWVLAGLLGMLGLLILDIHLGNIIGRAAGYRLAGYVVAQALVLGLVIVWAVAAISGLTAPKGR